MAGEPWSKEMPHPALSEPWGNPDYDPSCEDCRSGRHGRLAAPTPMPDEPKTESGRALRDLAFHDLHLYGDERRALTDAILAIEQEAASKAVAEVFLAIEREPGESLTKDRLADIFDEVETALIASERKP